ncbi:MAG: MATE family efflux transporter [Bacteroidales bacterium]|nr:MATE family efflux transporter [Bacteroidales bacterium]
MKVNITNKEIWQIALPIMIGYLAQTIITFTDTAFLGHVGMIELSASMMAGIYYFVFTTLAMGFAVGVQIFVARRLGEGRLSQIGVVFAHGLVFVLLLGITLLAILLLCSNMLLSHIIASPDILFFAKDYIKVRQFGIVFVTVNYLFRSLYVGLSNTRSITYSTILMAITNIFLDYVLIFGQWGFPQLGVTGAAIASLMAEMAAFVFFWVYSYCKVPKEYELFKPHRIETALWGNILKVAFPAMIQRLLSCGTWFMFFVLIEKMGEFALGVSSLVRSVYMILVIPVFAFAATANTLVSRIIGEGKVSQVHSLLWKVSLNCLVCVIPFVLITLLVPLQICSIYTNDMHLAASAVPTIYIICVATVLSSIGIVMFESISGTGNTSAAMILDFFATVTYIVYTWIASSYWAIHYVWMAEWVYNIQIGLMSYCYIKYVNWQRKKI